MKTLPVVISLFFFFGCKEISFKEPQPRGKKALQEIPAKLRGSYLLSAENEPSKDTLVVSKNGYLIVSDRKQNLLGDSLVLKHFKGYYFININEKPEWLLRIIRLEKNGDLTYMSMDVEENSFNDLLRRLSKDVKIDSIQTGSETLYQIDPSPKELLKLIEKGYFRKTMRMQKISQ
jgi:hypothetical protein